MHYLFCCIFKLSKKIYGRVNDIVLGFQCDIWTKGMIFTRCSGACVYLSGCAHLWAWWQWQWSIFCMSDSSGVLLIAMVRDLHLEISVLHWIKLHTFSFSNNLWSLLPVSILDLPLNLILSSLYDRSQRRRWALYVPMSVVLVYSRARLPHEAVGRWAGRDPSDHALSSGKPVPACTGHS